MRARRLIKPGAGNVVANDCVFASYSQSVYVYFSLNVSNACSCNNFSARGPNKTPSLLALSRNNKLAGRERLPEVGEEVGPLLNVLVAKQGGNSPGSLLAVVERNATDMILAIGHNSGQFEINLREHVVNNVVLDDAVEDVATNEAKLAINSGKSTLDKRPGVRIVVRSLWVGVVQVGDGNCGEVRF